jgi:hypothetical protein
VVETTTSRRATAAAAEVEEVAPRRAGRRGTR